MKDSGWGKAIYKAIYKTSRETRENEDYSRRQFHWLDCLHQGSIKPDSA